MNKFFRVACLVLVLTICLCSASCAAGDAGEGTQNETVILNMNADYPLAKELPRGDGQRARVILLLGQSNASGCSIVSYLEQNSKPEDFARYSAGYPSVLINYCIDDHNATSEGEFVKVDLTCGSSDGFFGPEVGMAEVLSEAYPDETIFILKYTMSGYSLHYHWLCNGQRGSIYNAFLPFIEDNMEHLISLGYDAKIGAVCWMQGESDTTEFKAEHYFDNQIAFVSYLREDLGRYAEDGELYFIDAGISDSPYCEPAYEAVNDAKRCFAELSPLNMYFSTIDAGFTIDQEPVGEPDWGHYDAIWELELGRLFATYVIESYSNRQ